MVELTQDEKNALIIITAKIVEIEKEKQACVDAHKAVIKLLEVKYNAVFNQQTGQFQDKDKG